MSNNVLFFYHLHTPASNRFERAVRDVDIASHATDIPAIVHQLPAGIDAVFVKTDHWQTDPAYFEQTAAALEDENGSVSMFDSHLYFEHGNSRGAIINGVEAAVKKENYHVVVAGLPIEDDGTYHILSLQDLVELGTQADWIAPAHAGLPGHRIPLTLLRDIIVTAKTQPVKTALGYASGYVPVYNRLSRNEVPFRQSLQSFAARHDVALLPELDLHAVMPRACAGCGLLAPSVIDRLAAGSIPVEDILAADLVVYEDRPNGLQLSAFLATYAAFLPLVSEHQDYNELFRDSLPAQETLATIDFSAHAVSLPEQRLEMTSN